VPGSSEQEQESSSDVQPEDSSLSWISTIEASPRDMELVIWLGHWFLNQLLSTEMHVCAYASSVSWT
jgi:hypothetical protein